jgi:hypothetical protein
MLKLIGETMKERIDMSLDDVIKLDNRFGRQPKRTALQEKPVEYYKQKPVE